MATAVAAADGADAAAAARAAAQAQLAANTAWLARLDGVLALNVRRISQADALALDGQLLAMLKATLKAALNRAQRGAFDSWEAELTAGLQLLMVAWSLWPTGATYGMRLLGLVYRDERAHRRKPCTPAVHGDALADAACRALTPSATLHCVHCGAPSRG